MALWLLLPEPAAGVPRPTVGFTSGDGEPPDELVFSAPFVSSSQTNVSHINEIGLWSEPQGKARGCAQ